MIMIIYFHLFVCAILSLNMFSCNKMLSSEISNILQKYKDSGYNKDVRPYYGEKPVIVNISMQIKDISSVSEVQMDFTTDFFLRQMWNDDRLTFNETNGLKKLIVGADFIKKIWTPDTFFNNGKQTSLHTSTNLETNSFLRIKPNGDVYYSLRMTVLAACQMDLKYFPLDSQICKLEIESYGYDINDIEYFWVEPNGTTYDDGISLPNFKIIHHLNEKTLYNITSGDYSRLIHRIALSRSIGYYINQVYVPAILIVVISWIPFWLARDDHHARVGLGVTTVLTMTTLVTSTNETMPKISYLKSLDIYLEVCFAMVFASLIQYAVVGYYSYITHNKTIDSEIKDKSFGKESNGSNKMKPSIIDLHCRWIFPAVYFVFNVCYWFIYLQLSNVDLSKEFS